MKKLLLLSIAAAFISSVSFATIRRVGFFGPAVSGVDYATLQLAHTEASDGDTIMMMPGSTVSGSISKTLVIIGPGYFLNSADVSFPGNSGLQANINGNNDELNQLDLNPGSSNSQIIGCQISYIRMNTSGILIKRCRMIYSGYGILFGSLNISNITFQQCVFQGGPLVNATTGSVTNLSFLNCYFNSSLNLTNGAFTTSGLISNCILNSATLGTGAWQISNSICQGGITGTNIVSNNNIGTSTQFPAGNGNQQNKPWADIFTLTGSYDGKYTLKAGSPAIGAGINGAVATDCGIFGGATPYRLSGIPSVPTIYQLTSPQGTIPAGNTVQINLGTRSNN